ADFLDAFRHALHHRARLVLIFTGAHTFEDQGPQWTDRFLSAWRLRVSFLTREELIPLLTDPMPRFDLPLSDPRPRFTMTYAPGALDRILDAANGQPFLTQAIAFELVQFLNEQQRAQATLADVETAIARALVSAGEYFANVWLDA